MFSGGTYDEVARWLWNALTSHAKREHLRAEVIVEAGDEREGRSYGVRFRLGDRLGPVTEFDFSEVALERGSLAWCQALAQRARIAVRELASGQPATAGRPG